MGPQGIDDGLEGGAEAVTVVDAPGGGRGDEVQVDGEAEGSWTFSLISTRRTRVALLRSRASRIWMLKPSGC